MPTALLSVYHKDGIVEFARELIGMGWDLLASGGTAKVLADAGLSVRDVATIVGGEPILGHRVVTLSREIAAGLLAQDTPEDNEELQRLGIPRIDLVCVDLYPLEEAVQQGLSRYEVIEKTDIGGPTLLREAAKGRRVVIGDHLDRQRVLEWLRTERLGEEQFITELCAKAEWVVARYCLVSAYYHSGGHYRHLDIDQILAV